MTPPATTIETAPCGRLPDGREVRRFTLTNAKGLRATVLEYGAILESMLAPDREGRLADLTLGHDTLEGWLADGAYLGATVGRFANRIAQGRFALDGREYRLATNNQPNGRPCHLHGGDKGFDKVLWTGRPIENGVELRYLSAAGEEGYPGNLSVTVRYTLTADDALHWEAEAECDAPTVVNLAHHSYWNLAGDPAAPITGHELELMADHFLPTDRGMIPTGEIAPVAGTPMDFTRPQPVGARIDEPFEALRLAGGYDHCWVPRGEGLRMVARLREAASGRIMELHSDQPGLQFYSGNFLDGSARGKQGRPLIHRGGLCLETQRFPDSPNQASFPSAVLRPGERYRHRMIHRFRVDPAG